MGALDDADTSTQLQVNERNDRHVHFQKYTTGSLVLKKFDSKELSGFVKSFDTQLVLMQFNGVTIRKIC